MLLEGTENKELGGEYSDDEHDQVEEDRHTSETEQSVVDGASDGKSENLDDVL